MQDRNEQEKKIKEALANIKNKILILSGKGGVGKSTMAALIGFILSKKGYKTGLMDVDIHGPSIPGMFGIKSGNIGFDENKSILPIEYNSNLSIISIEHFLPDKDSPVIWRGPLKIGLIRQFIGEVKWGSLDFLIIDSPPGTGDEPLTIAQDIEGTKAVVVSTSQEIALSDVRKSINFCKKLNMPIIGVIENMSYIMCPKCSEKIDIFSGPGVRSLEKIFDISLLGKLPFDTQINTLLNKGDIGDFYNSGNKNYIENMGRIIDKIIKSSNL